MTVRDFTHAWKCHQKSTHWHKRIFLPTFAWLSRCLQFISPHCRTCQHICGGIPKEATSTFNHLRGTMKPTPGGQSPPQLWHIKSLKPSGWIKGHVKLNVAQVPRRLSNRARQKSNSGQTYTCNNLVWFDEIFSLFCPVSFRCAVIAAQSWSCDIQAQANAEAHFRPPSWVQKSKSRLETNLLDNWTKLEQAKT